MALVTHRAWGWVTRSRHPGYKHWVEVQQWCKYRQAGDSVLLPVHTGKKKRVGILRETSLNIKQQGTKYGKLGISH